MVDVAIVGGGPAGLSAAVNVIARGATCEIISNDVMSNPLARSSKVNNYVGMCGVSGLEMLEKMKADAVKCGATFRVGRVLSVAHFGDTFMIAVGNDVVEAKRVILALGVHAPKKLDGEEALLGQGVSYCATCDGMLYRGKRAIVIGDADDLAHEAAMLVRMGVDVTVVGAARPTDLPQEVKFTEGTPRRIQKAETVQLVTDHGVLPCDVIFVLRNEQAAETLNPELEMNGRFIKVDDRLQTNIPGLFAAGDCIGRPLQVAKAVADGLLAAWSATDSLKN